MSDEDRGKAIELIESLEHHILTLETLTCQRREIVARKKAIERLKPVRRRIR